jgi:hypothetical protein
MIDEELNVIIHGKLEVFEAAQWCRNNDVRFKYIRSVGIIPGQQFYPIHKFIFENENDALWFRLKWE